MARYESTTAELDAAETEWWSLNGDLEDRYCWVQTPEIQEILRSRYLTRIAEYLPPGSTVLELGCGTGWLASLLVQRTNANVVGLDSSESQIQRARELASMSRAGARLHFAVAGTEEAADQRRSKRFNAVLMHGFLHHLSREEISEILSESAEILESGGRLVAMEPVVADGLDSPSSWLHLEQRLRYIPMFLFERGLRRMGQEERTVRRRLGTRPLPEPPFGPSPKETPFAPGELESILTSASFSVEVAEPVMCMSHLVAQDLLIAGLSQPRFWRTLQLPMLLVAREADRRLLAQPKPPGGLWRFNLFLCRRV